MSLYGSSCPPAAHADACSWVAPICCSSCAAEKRGEASAQTSSAGRARQAQPNAAGSRAAAHAAAAAAFLRRNTGARGGACSGGARTAAQREAPFWVTPRRCSARCAAAPAPSVARAWARTVAICAWPCEHDVSLAAARACRAARQARAPPRDRCSTCAAQPSPQAQRSCSRHPGRHDACEAQQEVQPTSAGEPRPSAGGVVRQAATARAHQRTWAAMASTATTIRPLAMVAEGGRCVAATSARVLAARRACGPRAGVTCVPGTWWLNAGVLRLDK